MKTARAKDPISPEDCDANVKYLAEYAKAVVDDDDETADRLFSKLKLPALTLQTFKELYGAEYVRRKNLDTSRADKLYGPDWLDR